MSTPPEDRVWQRDKEGRPLTLDEWAALRTDPGYTLVAGTKVNDTLVRTIWEGLDDGVAVAPMYSIGVRRNERWQEQQRLFWPISEDQAKAAHELFVAELHEQANTSRSPRTGC